MLKIKESFYLVILFFSLTSYLFSQPIQFENAFPNLTFTQPLFLTHSNDGTNRIFVVQQNGIIYVFPNDSSVSAQDRKVFLDVRSKLSSTGGEQGLLGLAFHPNYANNGYFYINYTTSSPLRTVVSRFTVKSDDPFTADTLSEFKIIEISQPYTNHNGGMILFGTDGYLYIGMGDGGSGGDPQNNAQNLQSLLGKILRINVDSVTGNKNYSIPPTNPFFGDSLSGREEIFAWGLRNPWRFSQDPVTGAIIAGDVGQGSWEEVDLIKAGKNYGWRCYEGNANYNTSGCGDKSLYTFPLATYPNPTSGCSVTGGYIYRGTRRPDLVGEYIYGDFCNGNIRKFHFENGVATGDTIIYDSPFSISSFGVDQNNELYICNYSGGTIQRFVWSPLNSTGENNSTVPKNNILEQNYPNPFNPSTTIKFQIRNKEFVKLNVYNVLGTEVGTLINSILTAGSYTVIWKANDLPTGNYIYRLQTESFTDSKMMTFLK